MENQSATILIATFHRKWQLFVGPSLSNVKISHVSFVLYDKKQMISEMICKEVNS